MWPGFHGFYKDHAVSSLSVAIGTTTGREPYGSPSKDKRICRGIFPKVLGSGVALLGLMTCVFGNRDTASKLLDHPKILSLYPAGSSELKDAVTALREEIHNSTAQIRLAMLEFQKESARSAEQDRRSGLLLARKHIEALSQNLVGDMSSALTRERGVLRSELLKLRHDVLNLTAVQHEAVVGILEEQLAALQKLQSKGAGGERKTMQHMVGEGIWDILKGSLTGTTAPEPPTTPPPTAAEKLAEWFRSGSKQDTSHEQVDDAHSPAPALSPSTTKPPSPAARDLGREFASWLASGSAELDSALDPETSHKGHPASPSNDTSADVIEGLPQAFSTPHTVAPEEKSPTRSSHAAEKKSSSGGAVGTAPPEGTPAAEKKPSSGKTAKKREEP